jgi:hypothetical protein
MAARSGDHVCTLELRAGVSIPERSLMQRNKTM